MKSYTDLEQSKKLAKFLPIESADMWHHGFFISRRMCKIEYNPPAPYHSVTPQWDCPCWSLAALLSVLEHPRCFQGDKPIYWFCGCFGKDKLYHEVEAGNPVDACYDMVMRLNELNLL